MHSQQTPAHRLAAGIWPEMGRALLSNLPRLHTLRLPHCLGPDPFSAGPLSTGTRGGVE